MIKHDYLFEKEPKKYVFYVKKIYNKHYNGKQRKYLFSFIGYEIGYGVYRKKFTKEEHEWIHIKQNKKDMYLDTTIIETRFFKKKPTLKTMETLRVHINYLNDNAPVYIKI